jgi:hypothetical protein
MDRLQKDEDRRNVLTSSWAIYQEAVDERIVGGDGIDLLARCMQELHEESLIAHGPQNVGVTPPTVWDGAWIQQLHQWRVTASGRRDASLFREHQNVSRQPNGAGAANPSGTGPSDVFISHASEDKEAVVRPLAKQLTDRGWTTWLDELQLTVGDSLTGRIDQALARSRFGVVILSHSFFAKQWPQRELAGLTARETEAGGKVILPVWHGLGKAELLGYSPTLADRVGVSTDQGIDHVAEQLSRALEFASDRPATGSTRQRIVQTVPDTSLLPPKPIASSGKVSMSPKVTALIALAQTLVEQGDYLAAETYLRNAVDSGDSHATMLLGMVMRDQGRLEEAAALLAKAVDSGRAEALTPLGLVLHDLGRLDEAAEVLQKAVAASG